MIRSINGKRATTPVYHLKTEDGMAETPEEIAEALADNYVKQSSVENHSKEFQNTKSQEEKKDLNFKSNNNESYNVGTIFPGYAAPTRVTSASLPRLVLPAHLPPPSYIHLILSHNPTFHPFLPVPN